MLYLLIEIFFFSPFDLIYSDVKGPFHAAIKGDSWYYGFFFFYIIIDDHTFYC
jgi:hypothetical protein